MGKKSKKDKLSQRSDNSSKKSIKKQDRNRQMSQSRGEGQILPEKIPQNIQEEVNTLYLSRQQFIRNNTLFQDSVFFKIREEERLTINRYKQVNTKRDQLTKRDKLIHGSKVKTATKIGSILCDPNITKQSINQLPDIKCMFFSAYSLDHQGLAQLQQQLGPKILQSKIIYFCQSLKTEDPFNQKEFQKKYTIIYLEQGIKQQSILDKLGEFNNTKRLIVVQGIWHIHGKLRLIKFRDFIRVCITSSNMSYVDFNEGGNVFWKRDFNTKNNNEPLRQSGQDFLQSIKCFLTNVSKIKQNEENNDLFKLVCRQFNLDGFQYDKLDNVRLIICPPSYSDYRKPSFDIQKNDDRFHKYGLGKVNQFLGTRQLSNQANRRVINIMTPFKETSKLKNQAKQQQQYTRLIRQLYQAFSQNNLPEGTNIKDQSKLRVSQMTAEQYYLWNKYEGLQKLERSKFPSKRNNIFTSLGALYGKSVNRQNAIKSIINSKIAEFHKFERLNGLKASTFTTHHTKMLMSTSRSVNNEIMGNDIIFLGSQNLTNSSWGVFTDNKVSYRTLQLGVIMYGHHKQGIEYFLPFKINTRFQERQSTFIKPEQIMNLPKTMQNNSIKQVLIDNYSSLTQQIMNLPNTMQNNIQVQTMKQVINNNFSSLAEKIRKLPNYQQENAMEQVLQNNFSSLAQKIRNFSNKMLNNLQKKTLEQVLLNNFSSLTKQIINLLQPKKINQQAQNMKKKLYDNFISQLNIQKNIFNYLIQAKKYFQEYFKINKMQWQMRIYCGIPDKILNFPLLNNRFGKQFQQYSDSFLTTSQKNKDYLKLYNRFGGFYIAQAVFLKKRGLNNNIIKAIMIFQGEYKISYNEEEFKEMIRINLPQLTEQITFFKQNYLYLNGINCFEWQQIAKKLRSIV